ncbi:MAG: hypothetical protein Q4D12_02960 [Bacteroidales bacterium]|nr:hypothetical protein [Bacteroidales bacterium]
MKNKKGLFTTLIFSALFTTSWAQEQPRLSLGGYGEAVMSRMFYSDNYKRYTNAELYKNAKGFGQFDLPHVVFYVNYNFGHGWTLGSEIEFEHGGTESAVEIEEEETGEYETEVERGGEVALEQFWIQKSWNSALNLRMGHIVVPVGLTNSAHEPNNFFTVYRPEGESTILPCTWHQTGISLWGRLPKWRYEVQFLAGLEADLFGSKNWINGAAASPYEFDMATNYATAIRLDNYSVPGLRIGISGYAGKSAANTLKPDKYKDVSGQVLIGSADFQYKGNHWIVRGNFDYGHLSDSEQLTKINLSMGNSSVSPQTPIASDAMCYALEAGYDIFSQLHNKKNQQLYLFGRYDYYDSMHKTQGSVIDNPCWERKKVTFGFNYLPIKEIIIKGEYSKRILKSQFNNEPTISLGVAYAGFFKL